VTVEDLSDVKPYAAMGVIAVKVFNKEPFNLFSTVAIAINYPNNLEISITFLVRLFNCV